MGRRFALEARTYARMPSLALLPASCWWGQTEEYSAYTARRGRGCDQNLVLAEARTVHTTLAKSALVGADA